MTPSHILSRSTGFFIIASLCVACHDENHNPPITDVYACHQEAQWTQPEIHDHLSGSWEWEFQYCGFHTTGGEYVQDEKFRIAFLEDGSLTATRRDSPDYSGSWSISSVGGDLYYVTAEPYIDEFFGYLLICEDYITFNAAHVDGCDNYFRRLQ